MSPSLRIGTRGSALALVQAQLAADALAREGRTVRIVRVETEGDRRAADTAWGEGAFVKAIERALLADRVDVAVHSAKDVPTDEDPRLRIGAYLPRADARDALVARDRAVRSIDGLPLGAIVGTDSPRRTAFLLARRPDLRVRPLHGNVDTRLRRLDEGEADALILACAGVDRLGRGDRIDERIAVERGHFAALVGFGPVFHDRIGERMLALAAAVDDRRTRIAVEAERALLRAAGGGCRAPIGAYAEVRGADLSLVRGHAGPDGSAARIGRRSGRSDDGMRLAVALYRELWPTESPAEASA